MIVLVYSLYFVPGQQQVQIANVTIVLYEGEVSQTEYGFGFAPSNLTSPGPTLVFTVGDIVNVTVYNVGSLPHAWSLTNGTAYDSPTLFNARVGSGSNRLPPGGYGSGIFSASASGNYYYICPVPGHSQEGMWGRVVINP